MINLSIYSLIEILKNDQIYRQLYNNSLNEFENP